MGHNSPKEIYFHVGLGKTASTFLQYKVFPEFKGIYYIQRTRYRRYLKIIEDTEYPSYFISNEFDRQLDEQCQWFSSHYPEAKLIIIFRRHDGWIASQYRRFVKNGFYKSFNNFIDVYEDKGIWKLKELYFFEKIRSIEKHFSSKPLVLFYEDMLEDTFGFIDKIAAFMNADYNKENISLNPYHASYTEKQLKIFRKVGKYLYRFEVPRIRQPILRWIQKMLQMGLRYSVLYLAVLIPRKWVNNEPLIPQKELQLIREKFEEDWRLCKEYAKRNNPDFTKPHSQSYHGPQSLS